METYDMFLFFLFPCGMLILSKIRNHKEELYESGNDTCQPG